MTRILFSYNKMNGTLLLNDSQPRLNQELV